MSLSILWQLDIFELIDIFLVLPLILFLMFGNQHQCEYHYSVVTSMLDCRNCALSSILSGQ
jgi:hypothetical protein